MSRSSHWTVISSREVLDASPFLNVRVETVELPDIPALRGADATLLGPPSFVGRAERPRS
jgi:hypothetical protein